MAKAHNKKHDQPSNAADMQKILCQGTGEERWLNDDHWKFSLKARRALFIKIITEGECRGKDWANPDNWDLIEQEYMRLSEAGKTEDARQGQVPSWAVKGDWMRTRPDLVKWTRREFERNNRTKVRELTDEAASAENSEAVQRRSEGWRDIVLE